MCIQFVYINDDPARDGYQLILANNRDESYTRPTKPAARWINHPHCVSGLDQEPSREGGTWFGVSEHGKIASLLNILCRNNSRNKKGRGFLVTDFVAGSDSADEYTNKLAAERHEYYPFNLVTIEQVEKKWSLRYFSSNDDTSPYELDAGGIHAFGNSPNSVPWKKVVDGKEIFAKITGMFPTTDTKQDLKNALLDLLNDPTPHMPDPQLESQAAGHMDEQLTVERSGIYVKSPQIHYGTRTNTLVLVDAEGHGEYVERTMREPVDAYNPVWDTVTVNFSLQS